MAADKSRKIKQVHLPGGKVIEVVTFSEVEPGITAAPAPDAPAPLAVPAKPGAGLHVEFKIDSLERFRHGPITMFSYDLVSGHKPIWHRGVGTERPTFNVQLQTKIGLAVTS